MKRLNKKQIIIIIAVTAFFAVAAIFVYLQQLRIEMTAEAGILAGTVVDKEQRYFNMYGEFAALEERSKSEALVMSIERNKYFTLMSIDVAGNSLILYARCPDGFFKGTELRVAYNPDGGVTDYIITEKTKIPLPRL